LDFPSDTLNSNKFSEHQQYFYFSHIEHENRRLLDATEDSKPPKSFRLYTVPGARQTGLVSRIPRV